MPFHVPFKKKVNLCTHQWLKQLSLLIDILHLSMDSETQITELSKSQLRILSNKQWTSLFSHWSRTNTDNETWRSCFDEYDCLSNRFCGHTTNQISSSTHRPSTSLETPVTLLTKTVPLGFTFPILQNHCYRIILLYSPHSPLPAERAAAGGSDGYPSVAPVIAYSTPFPLP